MEGSGDLGKRSARSRRARRHKPLCVRNLEGLELHAAVHVKAADRSGLQRLCRYLARPALPEDRLARLADGRIEVRLKRTWKGGVVALVFEPRALIARLAALIPLPMTNMRRFHGVFAPAHSWRSRVVPRPPCPDNTGLPVAPKRPAQMKWADLLKRVFNIDGLRCTYCGGRLRVIAAIHDPTAIATIIAAVHLADARAQGQRVMITPRGPPDRDLRPAA